VDGITREKTTDRGPPNGLILACILSQRILEIHLPSTIANQNFQGTLLEESGVGKFREKVIYNGFRQNFKCIFSVLCVRYNTEVRENRLWFINGYINISIHNNSLSH
jgi:hypothetical protein